MLERLFEEDEVCKVIGNMTSDKALGPDGFTIGFFQVCWEVVEDVMRAFPVFYDNEKV